MNVYAYPHWKVLGAPLCASGVAPFWHAQEGRLYWIDALHKRVWRHHLLSGKNEHWDLPGSLSGLAPCRSGGLLLVMDDGIYHAGAWLDVLTPIAALSRCDAGPQRLHGGRCDPWGRLWLASLPPEGCAHAPGSLYCLATRKTLHPDLHRVSIDLGDIHDWAWSPDGRTLFWCETQARQVQQATMSMPGCWPPALSSPMTLTRFTPASTDLSGPDTAPAAQHGQPCGGAIDRSGRYWVAMREGARVLCLNDKGQVQADIAAPVLSPSGLCFGGTNLQTLFITTTRARRCPDELARYPQSGGVFALQVDTQGLPVTPYWD